MTHQSPRDRGSLALALAVYRGLLCLYPAAFRQHFGDEMIQVFRDGCRAARSQGGRRGLVTLWLVTLPDLMVTAAKERATAWARTMKEFTMQRSTLIRLGGIMAFVSVFFQIVIQVIMLRFASGKSNIRSGAELAAQLAFMAVLLAVAAAHRGQLGRWLWGGIAMGVLVRDLAERPFLSFPGLLISYQGQGYGGFAWSMFSLFLFIVALIASIVTLRGRALGRWSIVPLLTSSWVLLYVGAWMLATMWITAQFQGQPFPDGEWQLQMLRDILLTIPGWTCLIVGGVGLLRLSTVAAPTYAVAESAQGK